MSAMLLFWIVRELVTMLPSSSVVLNEKTDYCCDKKVGKQFLKSGDDAMGLYGLYGS